MKFTLEIEMDNAAFDDTHDGTTRGEVKWILAKLSRQIESDDRGVVHDCNGNTVGTWAIEP